MVSLCVDTGTGSEYSPVLTHCHDVKNIYRMCPPATIFTMSTLVVDVVVDSCS